MPPDLSASILWKVYFVANLYYNKSIVGNNYSEKLSQFVNIYKKMGAYNKHPFHYANCAYPVFYFKSNNFFADTNLLVFIGFLLWNAFKIFLFIRVCFYCKSRKETIRNKKEVKMGFYRISLFVIPFNNEFIQTCALLFFSQYNE